MQPYIYKYLPSTSGNPYENLANSIIIQASHDYRNACVTIINNPYNYKKIGHAKKKISEIESFFMSNWFKDLTDIPGDKLLEQLEKEAQKKFEEEYA